MLHVTVTIAVMLTVAVAQFPERDPERARKIMEEHQVALAAAQAADGLGEETPFKARIIRETK